MSYLFYFNFYFYLLIVCRWAGSELFITNKEEENKNCYTDEELLERKNSKLLQRYTADYSR